ncbi:unnamed protein product [Prunus armeniaca]|uniref:ABC transmembrane type-1 domain-containing protein n=1 Tax=Prunus armeniaca TaxID=36596 RepID=A0A6J5WC57_PRUAR|nr:unnamed protein product [Prunus armeniaca]
MPSLQLLQLTEHGRSFMASRRKTLLLATGIVVAGGTAAYVQSRLNHKKHDSLGYYNGLNDNEETTEKVVMNDHKLKKPPRKKGGLKSLQVLAAILLSEMGQMGVRDLLALVSIVVNEKEGLGVWNLVRRNEVYLESGYGGSSKRRVRLFGLQSLEGGRAVFTVAEWIPRVPSKHFKGVVLRTALSNRLAKVQGFLFRAAFLRRVPLFLRLISENILLCFLVSTMHSTSKYITGTLSLRFRKILTKLIHSHYFENIAYYKMSHVDGRITNPEQRIASDVPKFCSELSEIVQDDLTAVTDGLLYTWRLCSYASPKYVFWILGSTDNFIHD